MVAIPYNLDAKQIERIYAERHLSMILRLDDPVLSARALTLVRHDEINKKYVRERRSLEEALEEAEQGRNSAVYIGRRGGRPKGSLFFDYASKLVAQRPSITYREFLDRIHADKHGGFIEDIDDEYVYFLKGDGNGKATYEGPTLQGKISRKGLPSLLSRAKKNLRAEEL